MDTLMKVFAILFFKTKKVLHGIEINTKQYTEVSKLDNDCRQLEYVLKVLDKNKEHLSFDPALLIQVQAIINFYYWTQNNLSKVELMFGHIFPGDSMIKDHILQKWVESDYNFMEFFGKMDSAIKGEIATYIMLNYEAFGVVKVEKEFIPKQSNPVYKKI